MPTPIPTLIDSIIEEAISTSLRSSNEGFLVEPSHITVEDMQRIDAARFDFEDALISLAEGVWHPNGGTEYRGRRKGQTWAVILDQD
jgi:predicted metallo-beta-lactamase superfamily hydrolase